MTNAEYEKLVTRLCECHGINETIDAYELCTILQTEGSYEIDARSNREPSIVKYNQENFDLSHKLIKTVRATAAEMVKDGSGGYDILDIYKKCLLFDAPFHFDEFCRYIEFDREPEKRFYEPRRKQLLPLVNALEDLEYGKLDLLGISMPPGTGKTTLAIFFIAWISGREPNLQNLIGSHNNDFLRGVYDELNRIFDKNGEYLWRNVFPFTRVTATNAKDMRIDLGARTRFQTVELTSIGSGNAGKVRATNLLYCDDLVEGIEQAMSKDQMDKLWQKYTVDLRQRKQGDKVKELHIATRWSLNDVIGRLEQLYENDKRAKFINIPAMNKRGKSNFDYPYGIGFTTEMYEDLKDSMDSASWQALYMGVPVEREGLLYEKDELSYFEDLPDREPDAIIAVCDTKEQGSDYCVMPIAFQYGQEFYIEDFVCDNGKPEVIEKKLVERLIEFNVQMVRFESNRGGSLFANRIQEGLKLKNSHCRVTTKWNQTNKETRIFVASSWVKSHCFFKNEEWCKKHKEYRDAMSMLCTYTHMGKNKHDDVPDAMADLEDFTKGYLGAKVIVSQRMF